MKGTGTRKHIVEDDARKVPSHIKRVPRSGAAYTAPSCFPRSRNNCPNIPHTHHTTITRRADFTCSSSRALPLINLYLYHTNRPPPLSHSTRTLSIRALMPLTLHPPTHTPLLYLLSHCVKYSRLLFRCTCVFYLSVDTTGLVCLCRPGLLRVCAVNIYFSPHLWHRKAFFGLPEQTPTSTHEVTLGQRRALLSITNKRRRCIC